MKAIILLGAPGAGKGTAAEIVRETAPFVHIATGDMLRDAVKQQDPIGLEAQSYMKRGELVPDELMIRLVERRLDADKPGTSYMFDGFPRTIRQAELLDKSIEQRKGKLLHVFLLESPKDLLLSRLAGRRVCRNCGRNYHVVNCPPKQAGKCDLCGGEVYQRPDDQEATILNRLEVFSRQTEALVSYYERKRLLVKVDSSQSRKELAAQILNRLSR